MVFDVSGEVRPGIEEACNSSVVLCEELDECWQTEDRWGGSNDWIIQWRRHRYHWWWQIIYLWVTFLAIKAPVITRSVLWRSGWLLIDRGQLRWIGEWIIQWRRHRYHRWWQLVVLWVNVLDIGAPVIMRSRSLPTLIVTCSNFCGNDQHPWDAAISIQ